MSQHIFPKVSTYCHAVPRTRVHTFDQIKVDLLLCEGLSPLKVFP